MSERERVLGVLRMEIDRELVESCLELFEDALGPCETDCECIIHPLRAALDEDA